MLKTILMSVAISSLILKLLDWIILLLESDKLSVDQLSFGYQKCTSTVMCSFAMTNVIEHYNNKGQEVYGFSGDISKGFDVLDWLPLFTELVNRKISKIFLRVMIFIYIHQYYDVRWNGKYSDRFSVSNGIRQGGISSPIFWNLYLDRLITRIRKTRIRKLGFGCHVAGMFLGIFIYADDIFLLCPSRPGLQEMVKECQDFARKNNLTFSTDANPVKSKTKCIIFDKKPIDTTEVARIILDDKKLPWVPSLKHLGMTIESNNSMALDMSQKRGSFIGKIKSLEQEFSGSSSEVLMRIFEIYTLSFFGSSLYNLFSKAAERLYTT